MGPKPALHTLAADVAQVLRDLNPWWSDPPVVRPKPPAYRRPLVAEMARRLSQSRGLIEVVRGPRQVGKTTGIHQIIEELLSRGANGTDILLVRFDLELLREEAAALRRVVAWFTAEIRKRGLDEGRPAIIFLDEVHKLRRWHDEVKHLSDTFPLRMLLTGSSSVLVARGGRESLAGRVFTTELPAFTFREVLECWHPSMAAILPPRLNVNDAFGEVLTETAARFANLKPQQKLALHRHLERYFQRGGYPRLHSGEIDDDRWADYLSQTVFDNVLGADIPDLFPVDSPALLRNLYLQIARQTGREISQNKLAEEATLQGFPTNQPTVGKYLHYLADPLLIREFRRYPLAKKSSARVPAKITVSDLGVRNAIFRGAPSLWESDPTVLGPLVETLVQSCLRDYNLQVHFFRDHEDPTDRRSPVAEVDFVAEKIDGSLLPIEVKFRKRIDGADIRGLMTFKRRFGTQLGVVVTRDLAEWRPLEGILYVPLHAFLPTF